MFVTFYSYKGGVGRSLALANMACLMAEDTEHPQRVLLWDFDLEAPGLHRMFPPKTPRSYGFVDLVHEYVENGVLPDVQDYIYESEVAGVDVLPAGTMGESYCQKLQEIDWLEFFGSDPQDSDSLFGNLRKSIEEGDSAYDYVLVDSRTGLNDQAGICTQVLSDALVMLFRLSDQDLDGLEHLVPSIKSQLASRGKEDVAILPVASQVGAGWSSSASQYRTRAEEIFEQKLEYVRFDMDLVASDRLFCKRKDLAEMWPRPPIVEDYERLSRALRTQNPEDTKTQATTLERMVDEDDWAAVPPLLANLLPRNPHFAYAWDVLPTVFDLGLERTVKPGLEETIRGIARNDPKNFFALQWLCALDFSNATTVDTDKLLQASKGLQQALVYAPEGEQDGVCRTLGLIAACIGNVEEAIKWLRKASDLSPRNAQIRLDLSDMYIRQGSGYFALAAEMIDEMADRGTGPGTPTLAYLRKYLGEDDKAAKALRQCTAYYRRLGNAHTYLISGDKHKAIEYARKVLEEKGGEADRLNWAEFFLCAGEFDEAISLSQNCGGEAGPMIEALAMYLKGAEDAPTENEVVATVGQNRSWSFTELLIARECRHREHSDYAAKLAVIERLIQAVKVNTIVSGGVTALLRGPRHRIRRIQRRVSRR
jgi:cellulose biosynthesis protein BcsQ